MEEIKTLINVYGYDYIKKELNRIREWLTNEELINNEDVMLPRGILFYGQPGNGKTLMLREYAKSYDAITYEIEGHGDNICEEIHDKFVKAREHLFAIILIDEIDLLIAKDRRVERILQQEMDGIITKGHILVLATTNNFHDLSSALTRPGRFDRAIEIDYPDKESRRELFKNFICKLKVNDLEINYDIVSKVCSRCSGAGIKAICNDAYLRCGNQITTDELEKSYQRICKDEYNDDEIKYKDYRVAIHEAGHALLALHFKDNWSFYNSKFTPTGGYTEIQEVDERIDTVEKRKESIMISLGGYLAEEVCYGKHDVGSWSDYNKAQEMCEKLIERVCIKGISYLVPDYYMQSNEQRKHWTYRKCLRNESTVNSLLKKLVRKTKRYLKHHKNDLVLYAKNMYSSGIISYKVTCKIS